MIATTTDRMAELLDTLLAQAAPWRRCCERPLLEVGASAAVLERIMASGLGNAVRYAVRRITVTAARRES